MEQIQGYYQYGTNPKILPVWNKSKDTTSMEQIQGYYQYGTKPRILPVWNEAKSLNKSIAINVYSYCIHELLHLTTTKQSLKNPQSRLFWVYIQ